MLIIWHYRLKRLMLLAAILPLTFGCAVQQEQERDIEPPRVIKPKPDVQVEIKSKEHDGKYYKDDGPPDVDEVDWRTVPDAEVAFAPVSSRYNHPYEVFGVRYVPFQKYTKYVKQGEASWYGRRYHGRKTSTGEIYDMYAMTAAHTVLPLPSYARVTRVDDGRSIVVRVNDRGPFLNSRIIDLSYTAARKLGIVEQGHAEVIVEALLPDDSSPATTIVATDEVPLKQEEKATTKPISAGSYLQLGAFSSLDNAHNLIDDVELPSDMLQSNTQVHSIDGSLYRVVIGPYSSKFQAELDLNRLHDAGLEALLKIFE